MTPKEPKKPKGSVSLEGPFWAKRPGILEHYPNMTPDEILVFDVLGLDVVTRPWFKPDDPTTHYSTLTTREIEEILPRSRGSIGNGLKALKARGWLLIKRNRTYIVKYLKVTGNPAYILDKQLDSLHQEKQRDMEILAYILDKAPEGMSNAHILDKLAYILDTSLHNLAYILDSVRFKGIRFIISLESKKDLLEIYDSLNMRDGDMAKMASESDLLFSIHDFFLLVAERLAIVGSEGKPNLRAIPKADMGVLFRAWNDFGPFAPQVVENALDSSIAEQTKKGLPLPMAYHVKAIANLQAEEGHKYQMLRDDPNGKSKVKRLIEEFMGKGEGHGP